MRRANSRSRRRRRGRSRRQGTRGLGDSGTTDETRRGRPACWPGRTHASAPTQRTTAMKRVLSVNLAVALLLTAFLKAAPSTTPVADAAMKGDRDAVRALLKQGGDVSAAQGDGMTALHWAAERGDAGLAGML